MFCRDAFCIDIKPVLISQALRQDLRFLGILRTFKFQIPQGYCYSSEVNVNDTDGKNNSFLQHGSHVHTLSTVAKCQPQSPTATTLKI